MIDGILGGAAAVIWYTLSVLCAVGLVVMPLT